MKRSTTVIATSLLVSSMMITLMLLLSATSSSDTYAKTKQINQPLSIYTPIKLVCPDVVDLKWDPEEVFKDPRDGCTFVEWELLRGLSEDREQLEVIYKSTDRS